MGLINDDVTQYNCDNREIGVCRDCGARYIEGRWPWRVTCPACRPAGIKAPALNPLLGRRARGIESHTGERIEGTIVIVQQSHTGHLMIGLDTQQGHLGGTSLTSSKHFELLENG